MKSSLDHLNQQHYFIPCVRTEIRLNNILKQFLPLGLVRSLTLRVERKQIYNKFSSNELMLIPCPIYSAFHDVHVSSHVIQQLFSQERSKEEG